MNKRPITPSYIVFYILFSPDTWRILMGVIFSVFLSPLAIPEDMNTGGAVLIYIMIATIGYSAAGMPGRWISGVFKKLILGDKIPK